MENTKENTIVGVSTPSGTGGIAVIRMSGPEAVEILKRAWKGSDPIGFKSHTAHLGWILDENGEGIDQVIATVFKGPNSYTGEDVVEVTCHGSQWIQKAIVNRMIEAGATACTAGEFTRRAFMNGRLDLAQAEGVADLISATSRAAARLAASQLKGEFSEGLRSLRKRLINIGSLLELELDFSEEDVEFANRQQLISLAKEILEVVQRLAKSFQAGNAFKSGVPVTIAGVPNAGKSTLLNALVGEEKAIVSDIPGTTRDIIEDAVEISGILFRFYDTAGLRESTDTVEKIGVERAQQKIWDSQILLYLIDPTQDVAFQMATMKKHIGRQPVNVIQICTKADISNIKSDDNFISISAKDGDGLEDIREKLVALATSDFNPQQEMIVTNARHYEALLASEKPLKRLIDGLTDGISADFLAQELREVEHHLGTITGEVTSDDILHTIFSRYCIGK